MTSNASMDTEINCCIGKASDTFAQLSGRVWDSHKLTIRTKSAVYCACVCTTLLYGSETWTLSIVQEKKQPSNNDVSVVFSELGGKIKLQAKKC